MSADDHRSVRDSSYDHSVRLENVLTQPFRQGYPVYGGDASYEDVENDSVSSLLRTPPWSVSIAAPVMLTASIEKFYFFLDSQR